MLETNTSSESAAETMAALWPASTLWDALCMPAELGLNYLAWAPGNPH